MLKSQLQLEASLRVRRIRSTPYQPYIGDPYDLSPISQCTRPSVLQCTYSINVTVPAYHAPFMPHLHDYGKSLVEHSVRDSLSQLSTVVGHRCLQESISSLLRSLVATPRCVGNNMVRFYELTMEVSLADTVSVSCNLRTVLS
jgi:hypothetical protein